MIHILVTTHGKLAEGLLHSANMLIGEQEGVEFVSFYEEMGMEDLQEIYQQKLKHTSAQEPCLIFCDIMGGTPFNIVSRFSFQNENIAVIYGVNLPILVEALLGREGKDFKEYIEELRESCKESIGVSEL